MVSSLLVLSKFLYLASATLTIGHLLLLLFFLRNEAGALKEEYLYLRNRISRFAFIWSISTIVFVLATLASILDLPISSAFDLTMLRSFLTQISLGKSLALQTTGALVVAIWSSRVRKVSYGVLILALSLFSISIPIFQSHSASGGSHLIAIGTLLIHVIAITLWIGGLSSLVINRKINLPSVISRYSQLALWAALSVIVSGAINAWIRLHLSVAWRSTYGILVIEKIILTLFILALAGYARRNLATDLSKLLQFEVAAMVVTLFLGTVLSKTLPPPSVRKVDKYESLVGLSFPGSPNLKHWLFEYQPDALFLGLLVLAGLLYFKGIRILKSRGDSWPIARTASFFLSLLIINYAVNGAIGVYSHFGFSYHMIEHMVLGMIAPIPMVLSAPITLALRTLPGGRDELEEGPRTLLVRLLHSPYLKFLTNPIVALMIFDGSLFVLYFTGLFGTLMGSHIGHLFMNVHFFLAGALFFHVIIGVDPNPKRPPNIIRLVILFAAMSIHAFFSIALMSASTLVDGGYYNSIGNPLNLNLLENQFTGGAIGWAMGEIPILFALAAVFVQWMRDDRKESKRIDRNSERASAMGQPDDLAKYNQFLAELARKDNPDKNR